MFFEGLVGYVGKVEGVGGLGFGVCGILGFGFWVLVGWVFLVLVIYSCGYVYVVNMDSYICGVVLVDYVCDRCYFVYLVFFVVVVDFIIIMINFVGVFYSFDGFLVVDGVCEECDGFVSAIFFWRIIRVIFYMFIGWDCFVVLHDDGLGV